MSDNKINDSVMSLSDRLSDIKLFINIMVIITAADVGLQVAGDKNLWDIFSQDTVSMKQYAYMGMALLIFIPFNIYGMPVFEPLMHLIYALIEEKFKLKVKDDYTRSLEKKQEAEERKKHFTVLELLSYSIKYNNSTLRYLYEKELLEIENNEKMKKIIVSFWLFIIVDMCYEGSIFRHFIANENMAVVLCLLFFQIGCIIFLVQPEKNDYSITRVSKRFKDPLCLNEIEEHFPQ